MKRELFEKYGFYKTDIGGSGDYEFVIRYFYTQNLKIKRLDQFILKFSFGGTSTSNYHRILKVQQIHANCWRMNGVKPPLYLIPMKLGRKIPQFVRGFISRYSKAGTIG
jgi:glycosyltransferase